VTQAVHGGPQRQKIENCNNAYWSGQRDGGGVGQEVQQGFL
jgi:hypothetical protein